MPQLPVLGCGILLWTARGTKFTACVTVSLVATESRRRIDFFRNKSVLISGASSGIGEELAYQLADSGARLTLAARREGELARVAQNIAARGNPAPISVICDVARDGDVERAVAEGVRQHGQLDVVYANAGFGVSGPFQKLSVDDYRRQFETNVFGVLRTLYAALPELEKARGNFAIVGSVSGWVASPGASPYAMSKFALRALANSITPELRAAGVKLTLLSPGFVVSNIRRVDNRGNLHAQAADPVPAWIQMSTERCARQMMQAVARGQRERIITGHGKLLVALERFAPWLLRAFSGRVRPVYEARSSL
ncbi:MAG: SDR family NAD(P)-dependent oxidoreductase [Candidatus Acidiferrales bacterium]